MHVVNGHLCVVCGGGAHVGHANVAVTGGVPQSVSVCKAYGMHEVLVIVSAHSDVGELRALDVQRADGAVVG